MIDSRSTSDFSSEYRKGIAMGDLALRVSLLVQRGYLCSRCGVEIDGEMAGMTRVCNVCLSHDQPPSTNHERPRTHHLGSP